jgi:hypothetical protein
MTWFPGQSPLPVGELWFAMGMLRPAQPGPGGGRGVAMRIDAIAEASIFKINFQKNKYVCYSNRKNTISFIQL